MSFDNFNINNALDRAIYYVSEAEKILLHYRPINSDKIKKLDVKIKDDESPTTLVDIKIEDLLKKLIKKDFPDHDIIGEESFENFDSDSYSDFTWIIDPLDGTRNYIRGLPSFSTQLALAHKEKIILGISNGPLMDGRIYAVNGQGAFKNNVQLHVSNINSINKSYISFCDVRYFMDANLTDKLLSLIKNSDWSRGYGDFWSYNYVAEGKLDAMIEIDTNLWDFAAVSLIVKEAGGMCTDLVGNPINFKTRDIIASNGKIHNEILEYFEN